MSIRKKNGPLFHFVNYVMLWWRWHVRSSPVACALMRHESQYCVLVATKFASGDAEFRIQILNCHQANCICLSVFRNQRMIKRKIHEKVQIWTASHLIVNVCVHKIKDHDRQDKHSELTFLLLICIRSFNHHSSRLMNHAYVHRVVANIYWINSIKFIFYVVVYRSLSRNISISGHTLTSAMLEFYPLFSGVNQNRLKKGRIARKSVEDLKNVKSFHVSLWTVWHRRSQLSIRHTHEGTAYRTFTLNQKMLICFNLRVCQKEVDGKNWRKKKFFIQIKTNTKVLWAFHSRKEWRTKRRPSDKQTFESTVCASPSGSPLIGLTFWSARCSAAAIRAHALHTRKFEFQFFFFLSILQATTCSSRPASNKTHTESHQNQMT